MTMPKWKAKLTKAQRAHLAEMDITTLTAFRRNREAQAQMNASTGSDGEACWDCRDIARRFGMNT